MKKKYQVETHENLLELIYIYPDTIISIFGKTVVKALS